MGSPQGRRGNHLTNYRRAKSGCWIWCGQNAGIKRYGLIRFPEGAMMAHRFFYEIYVGEIPKGMILDHLCRNRICVNPAHLEPVTSRENTMRSNIAPAAINRAKKRCKHGHNRWAAHIAKNGQKHRYCMDCNTKPERRKRAAARMRKERKYMNPKQLAAKYNCSVATVNKIAPKSASV